MEAPLDKTALSWWFPKLEAAGLPVPRTKILHMPVEARQSIWHAFDGKDNPDGNEAMGFFVAEVAKAAAAFGYPVFLRTDHTSGKHDWDRCCFVTSAERIAQHLFNIAEFSECADMIGLPWDTWAVREFLPTMPLGVCPRYGNMPVCREFRFFVDDGKVRCFHPYWPKESLEQGGADVAAIDLEKMQDVAIGRTAQSLAEAAGRAVGGIAREDGRDALSFCVEDGRDALSWSIDILETRNGWYVTDMAEAEKSFHWEGCENASK